MINRDISIDFLGVHFENPFCLSSSPVGNCYEMCKKAYKAGWGGIVFKTIGPSSFKIDEVSPRFDKLDKENTSFVGFKNMEQIAEHSLEENLNDLRRLKEEFPNKVLIASIMGTDEKSWEELAKLVTEAKADMIEMNLSCPQMTSHAMGSDVGTNPELCFKYSQAVRRGSHLPILAKMTPNITDMNVVAKACLKGGADGIATINTIKSIANVDINRKVGLPIINGKSSISGYSGKAVKPIALRFITQLRNDPELKELPISGIGGIENYVDALEFILLGASILQVTTAIMEYGYRIIDDLTNGLMHYLEDNNIKHLKDIVGIATKNMIPAENLDRDYIVYPKFDNDKCIGCGRCVISCFDGAHQALDFDKDNRKVIFNKTKCVGCHLCKLVCPVSAISNGEVVLKKGRKGSPEDKDI